MSRLARLVDGLLALARADAAKSSPGAARHRRRRSMTRIDAWSPELAARGVAADVRFQEALRALATPGSLEQVLDNLLSNALAVSEPGDTITIEGAALRAGRWSCTSATTGPG